MLLLVDKKIETARGYPFGKMNGGGGGEYNRKRYCGVSNKN